MAWEQPGFSSSFAAGADLSAAAFKFVKLDSSGNVILCAGTTDKPIGILQNNPPSGGEALVMHQGVSKLSASAAIAIDALVGTDGNGQGATYVPGTDTTKYIVARALEAAANVNELIAVLFSCIPAVRGA